MVRSIVIIAVSVSAVVLFGLMMFPVNIPFLTEPVSSEHLTGISNIVGVSEEELNAIQSSPLISNFVRVEEPDFLIPITDDSGEVVDNFSVFLDELQIVDADPLQMELIRTITFDDGTTDIQNLNTFELISVPSLDFVAITNDFRSIENGKLELVLSVDDIDREIHQSQSTFTVKFDGMVIDTIDKTYTMSDVKDGKLVIFDKLINLKPLLATKGNGIYTVEVSMDKFFIINTDQSRNYAQSVETLYTFDIEKSDAKSIKKDEHGNLSKVFDSDVSLSVSANQQSVGVRVCLSSYKGGGCARAHSGTGIIPAPALGSVTITKVSTGEVVASKGAGSAGYCTYEFDRGHYALSGALTQCRIVGGGGGSVSYTAQRGESYRITVSDPAKSWVVTVPEEGGAFNYSCVDSRVATPTHRICSYSGNCSQGFSISGARACNFP